MQYDEFDDDEDVEDIDDGYTFRLYASTKHLIRVSANATGRYINADATYKLSWHGFPLLLVGTTDADKKFHPFGLQISKHFTTIPSVSNEQWTKAYAWVKSEPVILIKDRFYYFSWV